MKKRKKKKKPSSGNPIPFDLLIAQPPRVFQPQPPPQFGQFSNPPPPIQLPPPRNSSFNINIQSGPQQPWNPMNMFNPGPPPMNRGNMIQSDEEFARKLQQQEYLGRGSRRSSKVLTNSNLPKRFMFKIPSFFKRRQRRRDFNHQHDRMTHRNPLKESSNRKKLEDDRKMDYRKRRFIRMQRIRLAYWNQRRKMNNHSSMMALSRFPIVKNEIGGKRYSISELLEGCYYTPGSIRGQKGRFQHSLNISFSKEDPRRRRNRPPPRPSAFPPHHPPPSNQEAPFQFPQYPVQIINNINQTVNLQFQQQQQKQTQTKELPDTFSDDEDEEDDGGGIVPIRDLQEEEDEGFTTEEDGVEICFIIDCTGSMSNILDEMKKDIESVIAQLLKDIPGVRFSFVVFGDYSDFRLYYLVKKLDFSNDPRHIKRFLGSINGTGGGRHPEEAYGLALLEARALQWGKARNKFAILIGDSIPYNQEMDPLGIDWRKVVVNRKMTPLGQNDSNSNHIRIIPIQCLTLDPVVSRFFEEVGENRIVMQKFNIMQFFEVFLAICYQGKQQEELDELVERFSGLSIDNVKKFHFKLNQGN